MARVNYKDHSFTCYPHAYPRMELAILPLLTAKKHRHTNFLSHRGYIRVTILPLFVELEKRHLNK